MNEKRKTNVKPGPRIVAIIVLFLMPALAWPAPKARPAKPPPGESATLPVLPSRVKKLLAAKRYQELIRTLRREKGSLGGRRSFLLGHAYLQLKRFRPAVAQFEKALRESPALERHASLFLAKAALGAGWNGVARRALEGLLKKKERPPETPFVYSALIRIHRKEKRPLNAAKLARRYVHSYPRSREVPYFLLRQAEALLAARQDRKAALLLRELWLRHPERLEADRAQRLAAKIAATLTPPLKKPGPKAHYERARLLRKRYHFNKALKSFADLKRLFPKSPYHKGITLHEALTLFSLRKTKQAGAALKHAIRHYPPGDPLRAEARYYLARNHLRERDQPAFEAQARRLLKETRKGKWAARTRYLLARIYEDDRNFSKAARHYREVIAKHPRSPLTPKARFRLAWLRFKSRDYRLAQKGFSKMRDAHPEHWLVGAATYWAAAAAERRGKRKSAIAQYRACAREYRHRYYGQLSLHALDRLGRTGDPNALKPIPPREAGYREWMRLPPKSTAIRQAAELLSSMGFHTLAVLEYRRLGASPYAHYQAALSLTEAGQSHRAIELMNKFFWGSVRSGGSDLPRSFWRIVYPTVVKRAEPGGANPYLVNALIRAESSFNPRAFSRAGARGLMQLMPATGRSLARKHKIPISSVNDLFDPGVNTRLGARHLGALIRDFDGAIVPAIASYNAGRAAVRRWWKKRGRRKPIDVFIEDIPYSETRNYVKRVLTYYREYKRIYGEANRPRASAP